MRPTTREDSARSGDIYLPTEGTAPSPIAGWDPARGTAADAIAEGAADDRGMEMLARVFVIGSATVVVLTTLYLLWPVIEHMVGGAL